TRRHAPIRPRSFFFGGRSDSQPSTGLHGTWSRGRGGTGPAGPQPPRLQGSSHMSSATAVSSATDTTFADLGLPQPLLDRVADLGFHTPTPIQAETIPALMAGRDVTGIAQTGTGKTAAFGLPLLAHLHQGAGVVQALVLVPTRELAIQVSDAIESFRAFESTRVLPVYGGAPYGPQLRALRTGVEVVVGTPGRMIDLLERGALDLSALRYLV